MGSSINKVLILGRVVRDSKLYHASSGDMTIARFTLVTSKKFKKRNGEQVEEAHFHNIVSFNKIINERVIERFCKKGALVYIEGELQYRDFEKDGEKKNITEVIIGQWAGDIQVIKFAEKKEEDAPAPAPAKEKDFDDEIPF